VVRVAIKKGCSMALVDVKLFIDDSQLIPGPQGEQGAAGPQGDPGPQGIQGPSGSGGMGVSIMDFGGTLTGDNTPALNAALAACASNNKRVIEFPSGFFSFLSPPNPINGIVLAGQNKTGTYLVRDYSGNFLNFSGGTLGGGGLEDLGVLAGAGTSGGYGIYYYGSSIDAPDYGTVRNLYVSSNGGTFAVPLMIDGQERLSPQGVRNIRITDSDFFAGTSASIWIANGVGVYLDNIGAYPAGGSSGDVQVTSGSTLVSMTNMNIQGVLHIASSSRVTVSGHMTGLSISSNSSKCFVIGTKGGGAITQSSTSSYANLV
jgi:hypothetical protein